MTKESNPILPIDLPARHERPSFARFLRGRIMSANGVLSGLYIALTLWVLRDPARASRLWRRIQGRRD